MKEEERSSSSTKSSSSSSLPVSYGVDFEQYDISSSVSSLSQPFFSEGASNKSLNLPSALSLDNNDSLLRDRPCSCLHHFLEWILQKCCGCLCY